LTGAPYMPGRVREWRRQARDRPGLSLLPAQCETAPDSVEMHVARAKQVSPTPGGGATALTERGGQARPLVLVLSSTDAGDVLTLQRNALATSCGKSRGVWGRGFPSGVMVRVPCK
jgi:hypothetical protein